MDYIIEIIDQPAPIKKQLPGASASGARSVKTNNDNKKNHSN